MIDDIFEYRYGPTNFVKKTVAWEDSTTKLSKFDGIIQSKWNQAMAEGRFRYSLKDCRYKTFDLMEGEGCDVSYPSVMILNTARGFNRRKPDVFSSMNAAFNEEKFNFTKIDHHEILFRTCNMDSGDEDNDYIIINVSPVNFCHILFVPAMNKCLPQQLTTNSLLKATELIMLSLLPGFRLGFNSLNAWASVNHLHFHGSYVNQELFCDVMPTGFCIGQNFYLTPESFLLPGFIIEDTSHVDLVATTIKITEVLHKSEIPYNFIITRKYGSDSSTLRILLCPRKTAFGIEKSPGFDVACLEVGGYFPIKTEECFENYTPKTVRESFDVAKLDHTVFQGIVADVKKLL